MPNNPTNEQPPRPVNLPQGARPAQRPGTAGPRPAGGPQPARPMGGRPTSSYAKDQPPGMGGAAPAQQGNYVQQHRNFAPQQQQGQVGSMNVKAFGGIALGLLLTIGGIVATMVSYNAAANGGTYTIWWGPVLFGVITLIGGVAALFKK